MSRVMQHPPVVVPSYQIAPAGPLAGQQSLPARLGQYQLLRKLGTGGMGLVHLAAGPDGRLVAIKVLRVPLAGDQQSRCRFAREVAAMSRIRSPFVAKVIDANLTAELPYIVTRYVPGRTLAEVVGGQGQLGGAELQSLAQGLAEALAAVHAAGVVHRDVKPGNVMMDRGRPVLIDFGIAYQAGDSPLTQTGTYLGTPSYLAPEIIDGQRARPPADVHGWGTTVGFAARGEPVYGTGSVQTVFARILSADASLEGIPGALYPLVAAALLRQPRQRPRAGWLAREVAKLDLATPAPTSAEPVRRAGKPAVPLPRGSVLPSGPAPGSQRPDELADLLPAVRYAPASPVRRQPVRTPGRHRPLAVAALAMAVALSVLLPLAGVITVSAALTLLRTAGRARRGHASRRAIRGPRARDPFLVAGSLPGSLIRSVIETALLAPLLLGVAVAVVAGAALADHRVQELSVWAAVAALYTVLSCVGPGSRRARRELHRAISVLAWTPLSAATTLLALAALIITVASLALIKTSPLWPVPGLHIPSLHDIHLHVPFAHLHVPFLHPTGSRR